MIRKWGGHSRLSRAGKNACHTGGAWRLEWQLYRRSGGDSSTAAPTGVSEFSMERFMFGWVFRPETVLSF